MEVPAHARLQVLFLDIVEYSKKRCRAAAAKAGINRVLTKSSSVPARDRIILDTGDGAAVTFMGDPEDRCSHPWRTRQRGLSPPPGSQPRPGALVKD